ncbi:MAG: HAMP domain-containing sensor histidine kinase [Oxalicibacterium faecigallinarum]|uniref:sensor histidine kinase n=1 Tax=Oxalicibacterium faecigallinarum TaxID=573741 RepID=UPI0028087F86|nr:HAMP domain-containing sensor histidine kinase [Oxalicibacterium faecigallinarum]MDQ7970153.1 HAMP domain-containing sensor histidine kinase [Oxalicibacterium faecigallinarum]
MIKGNAQSLRRRIVTAYLYFALAICTFFGLVASFAVHGVEDLLVDEHLHSIAEWASPRYSSGQPVEMPSGLAFYHGGAIPEELRSLPLGVGRVNFEDSTVHVLVGEDYVGRYVVIDKASEFKSIERVIYVAITIGLLGFVAFSFFLGTFIARGFVDPIGRLAESVKSQKSSSLPLLDNEDELGVLARAFDAHTAELKQFLARERFFTGDVSHELRTPLTIIIGAAELLIEQTEDRPALNAAAKRILHAAKDATECVSTLLLLARKPDSLERPETSVADVIHAEVERCRQLVRDKPVDLHYEEDDDFIVCARQELLTSAIGNLVRNACQYTEEGSVIVRTRGRTVSVEDTGPGIPDVIRARLTNHANGTPLVGSAGSGLGLALVVRICEHLGATLEIADQPDHGSIFRIHFPPQLTST